MSACGEERYSSKQLLTKAVHVSAVSGCRCRGNSYLQIEGEFVIILAHLYSNILSHIPHDTHLACQLQDLLRI